MAVIPTILQSDLVVEIILPFLLVFTIVFAVLQKTEILGKGKKQIDVIVALVIGLIFVVYVNAVHIVLNLMPFLAVSVVILLIFMLLWGFVFQGENFKVPEKLRWTFGVIIAIAVVIAVLYVTPAWDYLYNSFSSSNALVTNVIIFILIAAAIGVVVGFNGKKEEKKS